MARGLFDLTDRVAVVTGSGRGLGRAITLGLAEHGAHVVTCSRTLAEAEDTAAAAEKLGVRALALRVDTSIRDDCAQLVEATVREFGRLDVLVNNAGIDVIGPSEDAAPDAFDRVVDVDLKGYFHCSQLAGRQMLRQGRGSIINNSSIAATVGIAGLVNYSAAKGGVDQITRVMAVEWAQRGVRVNAIAPGYFDNIMQGAGAEHGRAEKQTQVTTFTPMGRRGQPAELVGPVVFLASDASSYVTGAVLYVDGGYTAA